MMPSWCGQVKRGNCGIHWVNCAVLWVIEMMPKWCGQVNWGNCGIHCVNCAVIWVIEMVPSWCGQVNWGNCGVHWPNCAVLCVKDNWRNSSEACATACQNCAVYSVFPSGMTSHSRSTQFNWQSTGCFKFFSSIVTLIPNGKFLDCTAGAFRGRLCILVGPSGGSLRNCVAFLRVTVDLARRPQHRYSKRMDVLFKIVRNQS